MCRTHEVSFHACEHRDPNHTKHFRCSDYLHCGPLEFVRHTEAGFCSSCYQQPRKLHYSRIIAGVFDDGWKDKVRRLLKLAPKEGTRHIIWKLVNGSSVKKHSYDAHNEPEFSGRLNVIDGRWLRGTHLTLMCYMGDPALPELTDNEMRRFRQIRATAITSSIIEKEAKLIGDIETSSLLRHLNAILTSAPVPKDAPDCPICVEPLRQPWTLLTAIKFWESRYREEPVSLPCGHIFGRTCIKAWVGSWEAENGLEFPVCPFCTKNFGILPPAEKEVPGPAIGIWLDILKGAWRARDVDVVQA